MPDTPKFRLQTLGAVDLRDAEGAEITEVVRQAKALAILTHLVLARPRGYHRRDLLLARFWPESSERSARHALSQQIYALRRALGPDVLPKRRGDAEVGVVPQTIACDVVEFDDALRHADLECAVQLYRGPFLNGFHLNDSPAFEEWSYLEQQRLERAATDAAMQLADRSQETGDARGTVRWLRRALEVRPYDESAFRRLVTTLDRHGERADALLAIDGFLRRFRLEFDAEPSSGTLQAIEVIRSPSEADTVGSAPQHGPSVPAKTVTDTQTPRVDNVPIDSSSRAHGATAAAQAIGARQPSSRRRLHPFRWRFVSAAAVIAVLFAVRPVIRQGSTTGPNPAANRVAVLFFDDGSADGSLRAESAALNSAMISQLSELGPLEVVGQNGVRQYRDKDVPLSRVAEELHAAFVVGGSISWSDGEVRAFVEVFHTLPGTAKNAVVESPGNELFALVDSVTEKVLSYVRPVLGVELQRAAWVAETNEYAWRLMYEVEDMVDLSREREAQGDLQAAYDLLSRADTLLARIRELDPNWARPLVAVANLTAHGATMGLAEPHNLDTPATNLDRALAVTAQAMLVDPNSSAAHEAHGTLLYRKWVLPPPLGDPADSLLLSAEHHLERALELEPGRASAEATLSFIYHGQGRFDDARRAAERAYYADPYQLEIDNVLVRLFQTSFEVGDDHGARRWCDQIGQRMPDRFPYAHCRLLLHAWSEQSDHDPRQAQYTYANAGRAESPMASAMFQPTLDMLLAAALARAGYPDSARAIIERTHASNPNTTEMLEAEAGAWVALKDYGHALNCLASYLIKMPTARARVGAARVFKPLVDCIDET